MSTNGILDFQNTNKVIFRGTDSNVVVDTSNASIGIGIQGTEKPGSNLHVIGDASISSNLKLTTDTSITVNSNVVTDFNGPHRRGVAVLKKYPEIAFESGKFDSNPTTSTFVQAGYTVSASSILDSTRQPWEAFNGLYGDDVDGWFSQSGYGGGDNAYNGSANLGSDSGGPAFSNEDKGEWLKLEMPHKLIMTHIIIYASGDTRTVHAPEDFKVWGSNNNTNWTEILSETGAAPTVSGSRYNADTTTTAYKYFALVTTKLVNSNSHCDIGELEIFGYEEDPPAGDISVDTTFKSILNTPQTTGANVYVDAKLSSDFTNQVTGPTPVGTAATHDNTNKYWEMNGQLTSNITVEANTFLEGDQPHAVSVWFNSSNLEANVSNTCVFSIASEEKLDSVNLDLQSNTWHNLTYAYQGEGGSRVTYLDGRKVAEDQAEDTFGDYPPFAMTGYSQGGYVVSASSEYDTSYPVWEAFNNVWHNNGNTNGSDAWLSENATNYNGSDGLYSKSPPRNLGTGAHDGEWMKIEMPYKFKLDYIIIYPRYLHDSRAPRDFIVYGSNDNVNWSPVLTKTGASITSSHVETGHTFSMDVYDTCYKYFGLVTRKLRTATNFVAIAELKLYGHRENDLARLPDPTNVLKYPHIAMTGPAQRGYVASASSDNNGNNPAYKVFDHSTSDGWSTSGTYTPSGGFGIPTNSPPTLNGTGVPGEYLILQLPHKLRFSSVKLMPRNTNTDRCAESGNIYGSDDGTNWQLITSFSGKTYTSGNFTTIDINASTAYYRFAIVVTRIGNTANGVNTSIGEMELYGTGVDSIPIQIGGGNIDRVANFRVYNKFIEEDQALEIWDAQKDEFDRAKSSMTLHKGRLGLGTEEPDGRLAVLDEPHNLEEFPPGGMKDYKAYFEGHGEFCASASSEYTSTSYLAYQGFDRRGKTANNGYSDMTWNSVSPSYNTSTGLVSTDASLGGYAGEWLKLSLPYGVKISGYQLGIRSAWVNYGPDNWVILGSNDDKNWDLVSSVTTGRIAQGVNGEQIMTKDFTVETTKYYKYLALVCSKVTGPVDQVNFTELRYFGTREQGQSVLHDGQLTLTKNLDVPRIGPALDADDTPRRDRLVVEYNTSTNPTFEGAVRDTSGRGLDAILRDATYDATDKSFRVGTSQDIILEQGIPGKSGDVTNVSYSIWFKADGVGAANQIIMTQISDYAVGVGLTLALNYNELQLGFGYAYSSGQQIGGAVIDAISAGQWYHVVAIKKGSGTLNATTLPDILEIYINGEKKTLSHGGGTGTLNVGTDHWLIIGAIRKLLSGRTSEEFIGNVSSIKYYDTVLTANEVKTLYNMGRCDEGHHVVNFSKTRVGIGLGDGEASRGVLDVRGDAFFNGLLSTGLPAIFGRINNQNTTQQSTVDQNINDILYTQGSTMKRPGGGLLFPVAGMYIIQLRTHCWYSGGAYAVRDEHQYSRYNSAGTLYNKQNRGTIFDVAMGASGGNSDMHHASTVFIHANAGDYVILSHTTSPTTTRNYNNEWNYISAACVCLDEPQFSSQ